RRCGRLPRRAGSRSAPDAWRCSPNSGSRWGVWCAARPSFRCASTRTHRRRGQREGRSVRPVWLVGMALLLSARAEAVETQFWIADSPQDYNTAEAQGVRVAPDGSLVMGVESTKIESDSSTVYWSVAVLSDGSV